MPDIFGRNLGDYSHLAMLQSRGGLEAHQVAHEQQSGIPRHDFQALGAHRGQIHTAFESNAQSVTFLTNNLQAIQNLIEETLYTEYRLPEFIPMVTDIPEGATTYAYRVLDRVGRGRFIEHDGTSAPSAGVGMRIVPYPLAYAGIVPQWTIEDLRQVMYAGIPLDSATVEAGTRGAMDHIELVGLTGDTDRDFKGLINLESAVNPGGNQIKKTVLAQRNTFAGLSADAWIKQMQSYMTDIVERSAEVFGRQVRSGMCIYLPIQQGTSISETRISTLNNMSVWEYFKANNAWTTYTGEQPMLKLVAELKGAGDDIGGEASDRMIVGINDRRVMEMAEPISPRIITTVNMGYCVMVPIEYKISGLNVKRPVGLQYVDGV